MVTLSRAVLSGKAAKKSHESGQAVFIFFAASLLSIAPDKIAMLHRLESGNKRAPKSDPIKTDTEECPY